MNPSRIHALTGIRAIAAIMVFLYHNRKYWRSGLPEYITRLLNEFHTGVSIFFVLSGFLIAYTYQHKPLQSKKEYCKYLLIRIARIFPVYWLILSAKYIDDGFPGYAETTLTYSLFHGFSDRYNLSGIAQAWSLTVELSFYTLAPFLYFHSKKKIRTTLLLLLLLLVFTFGIGYGWHAVNGNPNRFFYSAFFIFNTSFAGRAMEFFCGMLLAHYVLNPANSYLAKIRYPTLAGATGILIIIYVIGLLEPDILKHGTDVPAGLFIRNIILPIAVALFFGGLISERTLLQRMLSTKLMVVLGNASFIFYLIHIGYVNQKLRDWYMFPDRNFILLWLIAILLYIVIEKPVYTLMKRIISRW